GAGRLLGGCRAAGAGYRGRALAHPLEDPAVAPGVAAAREDRARERGLAVRPQHHLAAGALAARRGIDGGGGVDAECGRGRDLVALELGALVVDRERRPAAAPVAAEHHLAAAGIAGDVDPGAGDLDVLAGHHHGAALAALVLAGGRDRAADPHGLLGQARALRIGGRRPEHDLAVACADRIRLDHAAV